MGDNVARPVPNVCARSIIADGESAPGAGGRSRHTSSAPPHGLTILQIPQLSDVLYPPSSRSSLRPSSLRPFPRPDLLLSSAVPPAAEIKTVRHVKWAKANPARDLRVPAAARG